MTRSDLPRTEVIAERVYPNLVEDILVFAERLDLYPSGCLVLNDTERLVGYAIAHPWVLARLPKLNSLLGSLPDEPDTFFIHDVAILPESRGHGLANEAVRRLTALAISLVLPNMSLIAVGATSPYWRRHGFERHVTDTASGADASYGQGAQAMLRPLW